jgi:hypothetical protein
VIAEQALAVMKCESTVSIYEIDLGDGFHRSSSDYPPRRQRCWQCHRKSHPKHPRWSLRDVVFSSPVIYVDACRARHVPLSLERGGRVKFLVSCS